MMKTVTAAAASAFALLVATATPTMAGPTKAQKCSAGLMKLTAKKASCELGADAKAAAKGGAPDITKCMTSFTPAFNKVHGKGGCTTSADATTIEAKVDMFTADVDAELGVGTPNKCQGAKIKAAGKKQACEIGANAKAVTKGGTADVSKCTSSFSSSFAKAQASKGGCHTSGDAGAIETKVDNFVSDVVDELKP